MSDQDTSSPNESAVTTESAPVIEETAVETTESAPVVDEKTTTTEEEGSEPEQSKAVKELISQRKRRQEAEKEAAYWKGRAESAPTQAPATAPVSPVKDTSKAPNSDDFETWDDYEKAKDEYLVTQAEKRIEMKFKQQAVVTKQQEITKSFWDKVESESETDSTLKDQIADVSKIVSPVVADLIVYSDMGIDLVKFLDENPKEAKRISALAPMLAAKEIGKLETKLSSKPVPAPTKKVSMAPAPIKTVAGNGSPSVDDSNLPMDEWVKRRNAPLLKRR
jgi:hypothetical protein